MKNKYLLLQNIKSYIGKKNDCVIDGSIIYHNGELINVKEVNLRSYEKIVDIELILKNNNIFDITFKNVDQYKTILSNGHSYKYLDKLKHLDLTTQFYIWTDLSELLGTKNKNKYSENQINFYIDLLKLHHAYKYDHLYLRYNNSHIIFNRNSKHQWIFLNITEGIKIEGAVNPYNGTSIFTSFSLNSHDIKDAKLENFTRYENLSIENFYIEHLRKIIERDKKNQQSEIKTFLKLIELSLDTPFFKKLNDFIKLNSSFYTNDTDRILFLYYALTDKTDYTIGDSLAL